MLFKHIMNFYMFASRNVLVNSLKMKENNTAFTTNSFFIRKGNDTDTSPVQCTRAVHVHSLANQLLRTRQHLFFKVK